MMISGSHLLPYCIAYWIMGCFCGLQCPLVNGMHLLNDILVVLCICCKELIFMVVIGW